MMTEDLEKKFNVTKEELDKLAEQYESGNWPEGRTVLLGRPRISDEELVSVTIKLPKTQLEAIDCSAKNEGKSRSAYMRNLLRIAMMM